MSIFTTHQVFKETISAFFERDIKKLIEEISLYKDEALLWKIEPGIANSAGNLCLHLIGNLNHFIGAVLGQTGYIRNRDSEFSTRGTARSALITDLENTQELICKIINELKDKEFERDYPVQKHGETVSTGHMLLHLLTHFNYHLGQINYHRRMIDDVV